jgi:hypothetical protein
MIKILLSAMVLMVLTSCEGPIVEKRPKSTTYSIGHNHSLEVVKVDGCQYLYGPWGGETVLTHKGNCTNHIYER